MARRSETDNVKKLCACDSKKWSLCAHPWYVDRKAPKDHPRRPNLRFRRNLDLLIERHVMTHTEARDEAHRAYVAWLDGSHAAALQPSDEPTLAQLLEVYEQRPGASAGDREQLSPIQNTTVPSPDGPRRFGEWRAKDITADALNMFKSQRPQVAGNRNLALLRALFNWATVRTLIPASPFKVGNVSVVKLTREEPRARRLQPGEAERVMMAARGLRPLIIAALETGCRLGELLSLQWHQVGTDLFLPAGKTKAKKPRRVPISTVLRAELDARRHDPAGELLPGEAYVFGDEIGRRRASIKTAWRLLCQRAGILDLHFHDLRREAGSRWMDAGVPLATIQRWLGHHNISQTSTYLAASLGGDRDEMQRFEERTGRVTSLTYVDKFRVADGISGARSDSERREKTQETVIGPEPSGTVH